MFVYLWKNSATWILQNVIFIAYAKIPQRNFFLIFDILMSFLKVTIVLFL
jgi:hypothetical protein